MSESDTQAIMTELRALRAEMAALREKVAPAAAAELTLAQAMAMTNHRTTQAFYRWCVSRQVRAIAHGRYSKRRLEAALAA